MTSGTRSTPYLTIALRLFDRPSFCAFMRTAAFPLYLLLRRYVWRGRNRRHPVGLVNELYRKGFLVAAVTRETLAEKLGNRGLSTVSRLVAELVKMGAVRYLRTGRGNVFVLGTWEEGGGGVDESYFLEKLHEPDFQAAEKSDFPAAEKSDFSNVRPMNNKKKTKNRAGAPAPSPKAFAVTRSVFEPVDRKERSDDVIVVEF